MTRLLLPTLAAILLSLATSLAGNTNRLTIVMVEGSG